MLPHRLWASLGALVQMENPAPDPGLWFFMSHSAISAQTLPGQAEGQTYSQKIMLLASNCILRKTRPSKLNRILG